MRDIIACTSSRLSENARHSPAVILADRNLLVNSLTAKRGSAQIRQEYTKNAQTGERFFIYACNISTRGKSEMHTHGESRHSLPKNEEAWLDK